MHEILFCGQTLHFKNTLAGGNGLLFPISPVSEARRSICFPLFVPRRGVPSRLRRGRRAHVGAPRSLRMSGTTEGRADADEKWKSARFVEHWQATEASQVTRYERCYVACQPDSASHSRPQLKVQPFAPTWIWDSSPGTDSAAPLSPSAMKTPWAAEAEMTFPPLILTCLPPLFTSLPFL